MSAVTINIFQPVAGSLGFEKIGGEELKVAIEDGATLRQAFKTVAEEFKVNIWEAIGEPPSEKKPQHPVAILLNGHNITSLKGLDTELTDGDAISLLTPYAGGSIS